MLEQLSRDYLAQVPDPLAQRAWEAYVGGPPHNGAAASRAATRRTTPRRPTIASGHWLLWR